MADFDATDPELILKQVGKAMRKKGFDIADDDLSAALGSVRIITSWSEASTLEVTLIDPDWVLINSGFFGSSAKDRLPAIDLNFPQTSNFWWRLANTRVSASGGANVTLVFENRVIARLRQKRGHKMASRADMTRAEFIKSITVGELPDAPKITFKSLELHDKQQIAASVLAPESKEADEVTLDTPGNAGSSASNKDKKAGIGKGSLTIAGPDGGSHTLTADEIANANKILSVAERRKAGPKATKALVEAAIIEAPFFKNNPGGDSTSRGVFQLLTSTAAGLGVDAMDVEGCADLFLTTGFYAYGGAIKLAKENPSFSAGDIAWRVEGPAEQYRGRYDQVSASADKVIEAYGGGDLFHGTEDSDDGVAVSYEFERGTEAEPSEDSWTAAGRLTEEVGWRLFALSNRIYYFSEPRLAAQPPIAVIDPRPGVDERVLLFDGEKDTSEIVSEATDATMTVACGVMDFHMGEVIELVNAGPCTGRWIISDTERDVSAISTDLTLAQPTSPKLEPAHEVNGDSDGLAALDPDGNGVDDDGYAVGQKNGLGQPMTAKQLNGHSAPHERVSRVARAIMDAWPELVVTSTVDHSQLTTNGNVSNHVLGMAVDLSHSDFAYMDRAAKWTLKNFKAILDEGIHQGLTSAGDLSIKHGAAVPTSFWGPATWAQHKNHLHIAVQDSTNAPAVGGERPR